MRRQIVKISELREPIRIDSSIYYYKVNSRSEGFVQLRIVHDNTTRNPKLKKKF